MEKTKNSETNENIFYYHNNQKMENLIMGNHPYSVIESEIEDFFKENNYHYINYVKKLESLISKIFKCLSTETNPVYVNLPGLSDDEIKFLLKEHSGFTNEAIHMFLDANIRMSWKEVREEIERNMRDELGEFTIKNVPHLELMRAGYRDEMGIETENLKYSEPTVMFLNKMRAIFKKADNAFTCGALLALEATATAEFKVIEKLLRTLRERQGSKIASNSLTGRYILAHVNEEGSGHNPEDGHYDGFRIAIEKHIHRQNRNSFLRGFMAVCIALNNWWEHMINEIYANKLDNFISNYNQSVIDENLAETAI